MIMSGSAILSLIAPSCGHASTQALQCQHSSGYVMRGNAFASEPKNTSLGQTLAQFPQRRHFFLFITGGITLPQLVYLLTADG